MDEKNDSAFFKELPLPDFQVETPCFVIIEKGIRQNLTETIRVAGGANRLVPHVKTHRSAWLTRLQIKQGVQAFKTATPQEVDMVLSSGAAEVIWAYPTLNRAAISRVAKLASTYPKAKVVGLVDSLAGIQTWQDILLDQNQNEARNVRLRIDLDPGMGRTGIKMDSSAIDLAQAAQQLHLFDGWHMYDGHIQNVDMATRIQRFKLLKQELDNLFDEAESRGLNRDLIAGGSYSFSLWAANSDARVSPGSWMYSSAQHQVELHDLNWNVAGYVLSTVLSTRNNTVTLDAGSKAISPDQPMDKRFRGVEKIVGMKEEHTIVVAPQLKPGDRVALIPRHACTTAYLYNRALVLTVDGTWEYRDQLGCQR